MQVSNPQMDPAGDPNRSVYDSPEVAQHYAGLNYLSACEQHLFQKHLRRGSDILDLGVGGGRTTSHLSSIARRYVGVDYAPRMVEACRTKFPGLEFHAMDAADLSTFENSSFDAVVFAFNGIDCLVPDANRKRCLQECGRVLRHGGLAILSVHNPHAIFVRALWDQDRVRRFARKLVRGQSKMLGPVTAGVTCAKALITTSRAARASAARIVKRVPHPMFWKGEGWMRDSAHGGLTLHYAEPTRVVAEAEAHGFAAVQVLGDDYPRPSRRYITDWYYYVFAKRNKTARRQPCV